MPLIDDKDLVRIDLPTEGEWIKVKSQLSGGDRSKVKRGLFEGAKVDFQRETTSDIDAGQAMDVADWMMLELVIKEWSYEDEVTPANIRRLDIESLDHLTEKLNELYPSPKTKEQAAPLDEPGPTPIAPTAQESSPAS